MLSEAQRNKVLRSLTEAEAHELYYDWKFWARPSQLLPPGKWTTWLILAGRGWGKTRTGTETTIDEVKEGRARNIALVGQTVPDIRDVMVEGPAGILQCSPPEFKPIYEPSKRKLTWPNGAEAHCYSAETPDLLRGPQHDFAWCDEPAKWKYAVETWDMLEFGLRMGMQPRIVATTTPKPVKLIRDLLKDPGTVVTSGSSYENEENLSADFISRVIRKYEGTRLGLQELYARVLDDVPGALWTRALCEKTRVQKCPELIRIVVAIDPAVTSGEDADETGLIVAGKGIDGHGYCFDDLSCRVTPHEWATKSINAYLQHKADRIVAEVNNGGDLVRTTIHAINRDVAFRAVHATRGKRVRAEPIAAMYEQGRCHQVGLHELLEDEMCSFVSDNVDDSPNRMDAMVWAFTDLMMTAEPGVRILTLAPPDPAPPQLRQL